jgi:hypothetical protein
MYWSFKNCRRPDYVLILAGGSFTEKDFATMLDELFLLDYWRPLMPLLLDESEMDLSPVPADQLAKAAEYFLDQDDRLAFTRIAVVLGSSGAMRQAERFGNAVGSQSHAVVGAFFDRKQAEAWLLV